MALTDTINSWFGAGKPKEQKLTLHIHDDDTIEFRRLEIDFTCLIERFQKRITAAFKHFYKLEYDFEGYKALPAGKVTITNTRDVVTDLFNNLDETKDNIKKGVNLDRPWITDVSRAAFYKVKAQKNSGILMDRFTILCIILIAAEAIGIIIKVAT